MELPNKYEIAHQLIVRDMGISRPGLAHSRLEQLHAWLTEEVGVMLDNDFQRLLNILYRIDVSEAKISLALSADQPASKIASLIIDRELEKVETRRRYRDGG